MTTPSHTGLFKNSHVDAYYVFPSLHLSAVVDNHATVDYQTHFLPAHQESGYETIQSQAHYQCITRFMAHEYLKLSMNILPHEVTQNPQVLGTSQGI